MCAFTWVLPISSAILALRLNLSLSMLKETLLIFTKVSSVIPVAFFIATSKFILLTVFGRSGYLNDAFSELMRILNLGICVSSTVPVKSPVTVKFPVVVTFAMFLEYVSGITAKKFLNSDDGVLKLMATS